MSIKEQNHPAALGYSMPAEWTEHEATWLVWPTNTETWPDGRLENVRRAYVQIIEALLPHEKVKLLADSIAEANEIKQLFSPAADLKNLIVIIKPTVDSWIRDFGPTFLTGNAQTVWCKWIFNAWGEKYAGLMEDNLVFTDQSLIKKKCFETDFVLEGGSIEVNGAGTCLTTEQCLLNKNRNPGLSRSDIEKRLQDFLGVRQIIWLKEGVAGDDTDGHIDDIARFVNKSTILIAQEKNTSDPNHDILKENLAILRNSRTPGGKAWDIITLPMPAPVIAEGEPLPASYANFYIANKIVLLPVFDDPCDDEAFAILKKAFPRREVVTIPCRDMVYGLGAVHCLSQQEPKLS